MMWFSRLFGDTGVFGVRVELVDDPHPAPGMDPELKSSWGSIGIWVRGRCLTRSCRTDGTPAELVTWYLLPMLKWLAARAVALLNEEPLPDLVAQDVGSSADWYLASENPPIRLFADEEDAWFSRRSEWWRRHSIRSPMEGVAFPQILMRRLGGEVEIAWDNEAWPATRSDLAFTEARGAETVPASTAAGVFGDLCREVASALAGRQDTLRPFAERMLNLRSGEDAWHWLLPPMAVETLRREGRFRQVVASLNERARGSAGLLVEHSVETMLLRSAPPHAQADDLIAILGLPATPSQGVAGRKILEARDPTNPPTRQPWEAGYVAATDFRRKLGWGDDNAPPIKRWLKDEGGARTSTVRLGPAIDGAAILSEGVAPLVHVNPDSQHRRMRPERMMWAAGLGHLVMDPAVGADLAVVDSPWTYWPSAARARAFAAMLLMPEGGVLEVVRRNGGGTRDTVLELMQKYETGLFSTTWHLKNLRVISDDERVRLVEEVAGATAI